MRKIRKVLFPVLAMMLAGAADVSAGAAELPEFGYIEEAEETEVFYAEPDTDTRGVSKESDKQLKMRLVYSHAENLDDLYQVEIQDYIAEKAEGMPAGQTEYVRSWKLCSKKDQETLLQWTLHGKFEYDGKTAGCTETDLTIYNKKIDEYTVLSQAHGRKNNFAAGHCEILEKQTGKKYGGFVRFGVDEKGAIIRN